MHQSPKYLRQRVLRTLDEALDCWTPDAELPPSGGWLLPAREALGMSTRRLGRRMGVTKSAVTCAERAEREGTITLATLRRMRRRLPGNAKPSLALRALFRNAALARPRRLKLWG